ncbi:hypothetical protein Tco_1315660 [Tanacetum coccineum]
MSQPANDDYSQHLSDDEASYNEDASDSGTAANKPKQQQQQVTPTTTTISNIKLSILKNEWEAHGAEVSTEDANHKFLRSLPPAWSNLAMTMRTKPDVDTLSIDDLYNNLRHRAALTRVSFCGHTGDYSTYTPTSSNNIQEREVPAGFADEVIYSLFAKQSEDLDLLHEDLEQIDDVDIEEMDINWQIAMIAIRMKKFYKKTGRRVRIDGNKPVGFDKKKLEYQGAGKKEQNQNCLLTMDGVVNWGEHTVEEEETNHALMAISSSTECPERNTIVQSFATVRFTKTNSFKGVPHPLTGDYTPKPQEEIDDSLYVFWYKRDSKAVMKLVTQIDNLLAILQVKQMTVLEVEPSCAKHLKTPRQQMKNQGTSDVKGKNLNNKDGRELGRRAKINSVRPNINTGRTNVNYVRPRVSTVSSNVNTVRSRQPVPTSELKPAFSLKRPQGGKLNTTKTSYFNAVKGIWGTAVKTSAGYNWRNSSPNSNCDSGPTFIRTVNAKGVSVTFGGSKGYITGKGTLQSPNANAYEEADEDEELIVVPIVIKHSAAKRKKSLKEFAGTGLDFEKVKSAFEKVNTGGIRVSVPSPDRGRREGKANMTEEEETQASRKTKEQILQEEAGLAEAIRLDALEKALEKGRIDGRVGTWKLTQLKKLNFEEVKVEFENLVKQLDTYVPMNFEATKESLKRFGEELQTKTAKKLKFDDKCTQLTEEKIEEDKDDKPTKKTRKRRKHIARKGFHTDHDKDESEDSDEANEKDDSTSGTKIPINPVPVATKSPSIANYKIIKQGRKGVYQIVRENGTDMVYISFGAMLTDISRDDLTELYRIVMKKHGMNEPEDEFEKVLWEYLKNMFEEPLSTDSIWSLPGQQRIICWRYYDACRVHCLNLESADVYMLIERKYPLSAEVCKAMLDKKL